MDYIVIACENLKYEIDFIIKNLNITPKIIWIESGLHNMPKCLKQKIQDEINSTNCKNILLLFGCCGNALVGISSSNGKIICPRVDDCISFYLGGNEKRKRLEDSVRTYFFTKASIEHNLSLFNEMMIFNKKHGDKKTKKIYKGILKNYKYIRIIDTGAYNLDDITEKTEGIANQYNLYHEVVNADLSLMIDAFVGNWDTRFIVKQKNETILLKDFIDY